MKIRIAQPSSYALANTGPELGNILNIPRSKHLNAGNISTLNSDLASVFVSTYYEV
jgi:hypothetical protein